MEKTLLMLVAIEKWFYLRTGRAGRLLRFAWLAYGRKMQGRLNAQHGTNIEYNGIM